MFWRFCKSLWHCACWRASRSINFRDNENLKGFMPTLGVSHRAIVIRLPDRPGSLERLYFALRSYQTPLDVELSDADKCYWRCILDARTENSRFGSAEDTSGHTRRNKTTDEPNSRLASRHHFSSHPEPCNSKLPQWHHAIGRDKGVDNCGRARKNTSKTRHFEWKSFTL